MSRDETRYALNGVLMDVYDRRLKLVATDGRRLARSDGTLPGQQERGREEPCRLSCRRVS